MNKKKPNIIEQYYLDNPYLDPVDKLDLAGLTNEIDKINLKKSKLSRSQREKVFKKHKVLTAIEKIKNQKEEINVATGE